MLVEKVQFLEQWLSGGPVATVVWVLVVLGIYYFLWRKGWIA